MRILFIGDIFSKEGRKAITYFLPSLIKDKKIDFVIANAENCTHGRSLSIRHYNYLKSLGINCFTFGNHTWENEQIYDLLKQEDVVRPINLNPKIIQNKYGVGSRVFIIKNKKIRVTNVLGLSANAKGYQTNPFLYMDEFLKEIDNQQDIHIIDFHTNATSEKNAFFYAYKNKVSAILGTHTHIQTADEKIKDHTAYITDVGMTGPSEGIIGAQPKTILEMYREQVLHFKLDPQTGKYQFCAVLIDFDDKTNYPTKIKRIFEYEE